MQKSKFIDNNFTRFRSPRGLEIIKKQLFLLGFLDVEYFRSSYEKQWFQSSTSYQNRFKMSPKINKNQ